jgi:hypothetical protein
MKVSDIKNEILAYLEKNYAVRTVELIEEIKKKHTDEKGLVARGYNEKSLYRKIKELKREGLILEISFDHYSDFGIQDPDRRSKYLVLKKVNERRKFIDGILIFLKSKDEGDILSALDEIDRYREKYRLNPEQLTQVIIALNSTNIKIVEKSLWIFYYYMNTLKIPPSDTNLLSTKLKKVLLRFCRAEIISGNIHYYSLLILGILKDPAVVDQLMYDAKSLERLIAVSGQYREPLVAEAIEAQRTPLFEFERKLRKTNPQIAEMISEIRSQATFRVLSPQTENEGNFA